MPSSCALGEGYGRLAKRREESCVREWKKEKGGVKGRYIQKRERLNNDDKFC